jgi:mannose-1-phosphate guanylyltransferase
MIADVRLFPHAAAAGSPVVPRLWVFVLLGPPPRRDLAALRRALQRAVRLAPAQRVVAVLSRDSVRRYDGPLAETPGVARIVQPTYRGSAAELFLPALLVARRDPDAVIIALRADETHDGPLTPCLARAVRAVGLHPELTVLVGARPRTTRGDDGLVEPGPPLPGLEELSVLAVRRFVYEPPPGLGARSLLVPAALAARARRLVALGRRYIPEVLETLEPLEEVSNPPEAALLCEAVYECMPYASLTREFLERVPDLAVLPAPDAFLDAGEAVAHLAS